MPKSHRNKKFSNRVPKRRIVIVLLVAAVAVVSLMLLSAGSRSSGSVYASQNSKRYKATRAIVVDQQTGQRRMPNQEEIDQVVGNLSVLASRPEDLPQTSIANNAVAVDLAGGYGGVMLARPNAEGGWETRCVFTFAEGAEFLGLVEDNSTE